MRNRSTDIAQSQFKFRRWRCIFRLVLNQLILAATCTIVGKFVPHLGNSSRKSSRSEFQSRWRNSYLIMVGWMKSTHSFTWLKTLRDVAGLSKVVTLETKVATLNLLRLSIDKQWKSGSRLLKVWLPSCSFRIPTESGTFESFLLSLKSAECLDRCSDD